MSDPLSATEARRRLISAAREGNLVEIKQILAIRPDAAKLRNSHHNTALRSAVADGQLLAARLLVTHGADVFQKNHGGSSLMEAATYSGNKSMVVWLGECGLEVGIDSLCAVGDLPAVKKLVQVDPTNLRFQDRRGLTPLHHAARSGHTEIIDWLVDQGADLHAQNKHGHEPIAVAAEDKKTDSVACLLKHGANPNANGGHFRGTILHRAILNKSAEIVKALLAAGADPNRRDASGKTPLHEAIQVGNKALVLQLVKDVRTDLSIRSGPTKFSEKGETPLEYAQNRKKTGIAELLVGLG